MAGVARMGFTEVDLRNSPDNPDGFASLLARMNDYLGDRGIKAYIVGGLVRDMLLGRDTADIDIAVDADALEVVPRIAADLGGKYVLLDKENRVARLVLAGNMLSPGTGRWDIDFSTFEGSIEHDLARRDFTVDAMAVELRQMVDYLRSLAPLDSRKRSRSPHAVPGLIDPFHGVGDLHQGVIRVVSETAFTADAARLLRAVRLAAELGFIIDKKTEALIRRDSRLLAGVAGERVREELLRLLAIPPTEQVLFYLDELELLTAVFPELAETKGVEQPKEHHWNVFYHSLKTVAAVEFLLRRGKWEYASEATLPVVPWSAMLAQHFEQEVSGGSTRVQLLKLAALLHDIAKPQTRAVAEGGRVRFLGHAIEGASAVASMLERLRFSVREIKLVEALVRHHLRPTQMSQEGLPSRRAIYRYFRDTGEAGIDVLFLSLADHLATRGPNLDTDNWREHARVVEYVLSQHFEQESIVRSPRLVDGHDLIDLLAMKPGPEIGEILEAVREAQAAGELSSREDALSFIRDYHARSLSQKQ